MKDGYTENPGREGQEDRVDLAFQRFTSYGDPLWKACRMSYELICKVLGAEGSRVLDVGCGVGIGTDLLAQCATVTGVDIVQSSVWWAKMNFSRPHFELWDISKGPFPGKWDVVVCVDVIEHIKDYRAAMKHLVWCAPVVLLTTPNRASGTMPADHPGNMSHVREFVPEEVQEIVLGAGGKITQMCNLLREAVDYSTKDSPVLYRIGRVE